MSDIRFSRNGAFKRPKPKAGKRARDGSFHPDIFKFQRPLMTPEGQEPKVLVYNESRSWEGQIPCLPELMALFGDELKFYAICKPRPDGQLELIEMITPQPW